MRFRVQSTCMTNCRCYHQLDTVLSLVFWLLFLVSPHFESKWSCSRGATKTEPRLGEAIRLSVMMLRTSTPQWNKASHSKPSQNSKSCSQNPTKLQLDLNSKTKAKTLEPALPTRNPIQTKDSGNRNPRLREFYHTSGSPGPEKPVGSFLHEVGTIMQGSSFSILEATGFRSPMFHGP